VSGTGRSGPGGPDAVRRSRLPDLVRQEVYGLLCVYQAVRARMTAGAEHACLDPDRLSFTRAKEAAARHLSEHVGFPPDDLADLVDDVIYEITDPATCCPPSKRERTFAREQKQPERHFPVRRPNARNRYHPARPSRPGPSLPEALN